MRWRRASRSLPRRIRTLRRRLVGVPVLLALLVAGCGAGEREQTVPALPPELASQLAARSDAVAAKLDAGDPCGALVDAQGLQQDTIAAINSGRVPPRYQEELTASAGALAASITCTITPPPTPESTAPSDDDENAEEDRGGRGDEDGEDGDEGKKKKGKGKEGKGKKG